MRDSHRAPRAAAIGITGVMTAVLAAAVLAGCTLLPTSQHAAKEPPSAPLPAVPTAPASAPAAPQPVAAPGDDALQRLLGLHERSRGLPTAELAREQARLAASGGAEAALARVLLARLAEQRRLEEQLERQAQQQRELQRRNDQLREQLDALRAIERSLGPRPAAPASR